MRSSLAWLLAPFVLVACSAATGSDESTPAGDDAGTTTDDGGTPGEDAPIPTDGLALVKGLSIKEIAVFQGPKISVSDGSAKVTARKAPVVVGRSGVLRVYVEPAADWAPREVVATLKLTSGGATKVLTEKKTPSGASTDANLDSTFNFELATDLIAADTSYSVDLKTEPGETSSGDGSKSQYPAGGGTETLDAKGTGDALQVRIVPVRYDADGSGRLPDTSPTQLERYRKRFQQLYPARKVEITVRDAPYPWSTTISRTGSGFSNLLNAIIKLRQSDAPGKGVYYYAAFSPASSIYAFCSSGCVAGLSPLATNPGDTWTAASVGLGFSGDQAPGTAVHEVGHGHGRKHSPCAPGGGTLGDADPAYPYPGAKIGAWSWDVEAKKLVNPGSSVTDFMSYCDPTWSSDWTFGALATRMAYVYGAFEIPGPPQTYRLVSVDADGNLSWGDEVVSSDPTWGEPRTVRLESVDGRTATVSAAFYPYDHVDGGILVVPVGSASIKRIAGEILPNVRSALEIAR